MPLGPTLGCRVLPELLLFLPRPTVSKRPLQATTVAATPATRQAGRYPIQPNGGGVFNLASLLARTPSRQRLMAATSSRSLMPGDPQFRANAPLLIAGAWPGGSAWSIPMAVQRHDPAVVIDALEKADDPHRIAGDHRQRIIGQAGRASSPVEVGRQRHGRQDTTQRLRSCDANRPRNGRGCRRRHSRGAGA